MKLELWMIVAAGVTCAAGFGILAVLMLSLDGQVRRLSRQAGALQGALEANLKGLLAETAVTRPAGIPPVAASASLPAAPPPPPVRPSMPAPASGPAPPAAPPAPPLLLPRPVAAGVAGEDTLASRWTPERRLLVMRLAARGNPAEQIAAALRIPRQEIDLFIRLNGLEAAVPSGETADAAGLPFATGTAAAAAGLST